MVRVVVYVIAAALLVLGLAARVSLYGDDRGLTFEGGEEFVVDGVVERVVGRDSASVRVFVDSDSLWVEGMRIGDGGVKVCVKVKGELSSGDAVKIKGRVVLPFVDVFSGYDYGEYLRTHGVEMLGRGEVIEHRGRAGGLSGMGGMVADWYEERLRAMGVNEEGVWFMRALVLGDRSGLGKDTRAAFSACGTSHVLAVSGLHVGVLAWVVGWLLSAFCSHRLKSIATIAVLWCYVVVVGMGPSVMRAAVMLTFTEIGWMRGRRVTVWRSLLSALLFIVMVDPMSVFDISLWLSFLAVGGLCMGMRPIEHWMQRWTKVEKWNNTKWRRIRSGILRWLLSSLAVSVVAQLATLPVIAYCFGVFPVYFLINNLLIVPGIWLTFNIGVLSILVSWIPLISDLCGWALNTLVWLMEGYSAWAGSLPSATIGTGPRSVMLLVGMLAAVWGLLVWMRWRRAWALICGLVCLIVGWGVVEMGREAGVGLLTSGGKLGVVVTDGREAKALMSDCRDRGLERAIGEWAKVRGVGIKEIRGMHGVERVRVGERCVTVVNESSAETTDNDIVVVNCDGWKGQGSYASPLVEEVSEGCERLEARGVVWIGEE